MNQQKPRYNDTARGYYRINKRGEKEFVPEKRPPRLPLWKMPSDSSSASTGSIESEAPHKPPQDYYAYYRAYNNLPNQDTSEYARTAAPSSAAESVVPAEIYNETEEGEVNRRPQTRESPPERIPLWKMPSATQSSKDESEARWEQLKKEHGWKPETQPMHQNVNFSTVEHQQSDNNQPSQQFTTSPGDNQTSLGSQKPKQQALQACKLRIRISTPNWSLRVNREYRKVSWALDQDWTIQLRSIPCYKRCLRTVIVHTPTRQLPSRNRVKVTPATIPGILSTRPTGIVKISPQINNLPSSQ